MKPLNPAERRALRAKAHHLEPVVIVGQHGLTPAVLHEIDLALAKHELVKVRVFSDARDEREAPRDEHQAELPQDQSAQTGSAEPAVDCAPTDPPTDALEELVIAATLATLPARLFDRLAMRDVAGKRIAVIAETPAHDLLRDLTGSFSGEYPSFAIDVLPADTPFDKLLKRIDLTPAKPAAAGANASLAASPAADYAVVDSSEFAVGKRLHPDLAAAFNLGRERRLAWAFSSVSDIDLQQSAMVFFDKIRNNGTLARLIDRYYGHVNRIQAVDAEAIIEKIESLLPKLKNYFHEAQQLTGIDWRLLAAVGYQESHWDALATSPTGVRGLMMLTDDTADRMNVKNRLDARESIVGGAKYLMKLRETVPERIAEPDRTWLALAAYNQGYGHLEDASILTARLKLNADSWLDVRKAYPKLSQTETFESLKHGYARGEEAVQFVENIRNYADILNKLEKPLALDAGFAAALEDAELANAAKAGKHRLNLQKPVRPEVASGGK